MNAALDGCRSLISPEALIPPKRSPRPSRRHSLRMIPERIRHALRRGNDDPETGEIVNEEPFDGRIGDNSIGGDALRLYIERVERLSEEVKGLQDDIKDVFLEARSTGFDPKTMRTIIRLRKMDKNSRDEMEALLETYLSALGMS